MATRTPDPTERHEHCETCDTETAHAVRVELRTESDGAANPEYSREPYRVAECRSCGQTSHRRMNNA